jgi:simple sugar transport system ATP-binding protein
VTSEKAMGGPFQSVKEGVDGVQEGCTIVAEGRNISKRFGATQALRDVSIEIRAGEIHALVGRNGCGKSTFVGVISGLLAQDAGAVYLQSEPAPGRSDRRRWRELVACVYQKPTVVPSISVAENLFLGSWPSSSMGAVRWKEMRQRAQQSLSEWNVNVDPRTEASELTVSERKVVEIVRALVLGTRFVILDEPTAGLEASETSRLFERIQSLQENGVAFLYISHHLDEVFELAHRVTVLRDGCKVATRDMRDLSKDQLIADMVGQTGSAKVASSQRSTGPHPSRTKYSAVLDVRNLTVDGSCADVSLRVFAGECVGLAGHAGSGSTAVADSIVGLSAYQAGEIVVGDKPLPANRPATAIEMGVGHVPQDRYKRGFVASMSLMDNATQPILHRLGRLGLVSPSAQESEAKLLVQSLDIKAESTRQEMSQLSGGNQQKVTLARALSSKPSVLVLVNPTAGVDIASKTTILATIKDLQLGGTGVLLVSDEEDELRLCDRIVVMCRGRVSTQLSNRQWTERELVSAMGGVGEAQS